MRQAPFKIEVEVEFEVKVKAWQKLSKVYLGSEDWHIHSSNKMRTKLSFFRLVCLFGQVVTFNQSMIFPKYG